MLATTAGGGVAGQADALRLGIARARVVFNGVACRTARPALLTRDPRAKGKK
jgi:small subunit ribosomal protein S9